MYSTARAPSGWYYHKKTCESSRSRELCEISVNFTSDTFFFTKDSFLFSILSFDCLRPSTFNVCEIPFNLKFKHPSNLVRLLVPCLRLWVAFLSTLCHSLVNTLLRHYLSITLTLKFRAQWTSFAAIVSLAELPSRHRMPLSQNLYPDVLTFAADV